MYGEINYNGGNRLPDVEAEVKILTADKDLLVPRGGHLRVRYKSEKKLKIGLVVVLQSFRFSIAEAAHGEFPVSCFSTVLGPGQEGAVTIVDKWAGRKTTEEEYGVYTSDFGFGEGTLKFSTGSSLSTWSYAAWNMEHPVDRNAANLKEEERKKVKKATFAKTETLVDNGYEYEDIQNEITVKTVKMAEESASYREVREKVEAAVRFKNKKYAYESHGEDGVKTIRKLPDVVAKEEPKKVEPKKMEPKKVEPVKEEAVKKRACCTVS